MKKNLLLLLWMTLLPLAGWAASEVEVKPYNISKFYGQSDADINLAYKTSLVSGSDLTDDQKNALRGALSIVRNGANAGNAIGDYSYTLQYTPSQALDGVVVFIDGSATLSISPMPLNNQDVTVEAIPDQSLTGDAITPALTIRNNGELVPESEYKVAWVNNTGVGTATGTITPLTGNYSGTREVTFQIKTGLENATIVLEGVDNLQYNGNERKPSAVKVYSGEVDPNNLLADINYDITYPSGDYTNAGEKTVTVTGKGSYSGSRSATYMIGRKQVAADAIAYTLSAPSYPYTGSAVAPVLTALTENQNNILDAANYEISNPSKNAGEATATLTLKGNYEGSKTINYTIAQKDFSNLTIELAQEQGAALNTYTYNKVDIKPAVTVKDGETVLPTSEYSVAWKDNNDQSDEEDLKNAGAKKVVITPLQAGNYYQQDAINVNYTIAPRPLRITVADLTVGIGATPYPTATIDNYAEGEGIANLSNNGQGKVTFKYHDVELDQDTDAPTAALTNNNHHVNIVPVVTAFTNTNYSYTNLENGVLTVIEGQLTAQVDNQEVVFGTEFAQATIVHKSGLAPNDVADFNAHVNTTGITYKVYTDKACTLEASKMKDAQDQDLTFYPAGTYYVKATGTATYPGYNVSLATGTWTVTAKPIADVTFDNNGFSREYTAAADLPTTATKLTWANLTLAETTDYNVELVTTGNNVDNVNVSNTKTGKIKFTAVANGNYSGEVEKTFTITKKNLTVTADNFTGDKKWKYGEEEPTYTAKVDGLIGEDAPITLTAGEANAILGILTVTRNSNTGVGMHPQALVPSLPENTNYSFTCYPGDLEIGKGTVTVKVKQVKVMYGEAPTFTLEYVDGLPAEDVANFEQIINFSTDANDYGYNANEMKDVNAEGYDLTYAGVDPTSTNFDVAFLNDSKAGKLIITKRPVKFQAKPQQTTYTNLSTLLSNLAVSNTYIDNVEEQGFPAPVAGDEVNELIASIKAASTRISNDNEIVLTAKTDGVAANYEIECVPGNLTITSVGVPTIALNRVAQADFGGVDDTAAQLITDYSADDNNSVNVTFTFPGHTMKKETWYSWVLPFATSVKEISEAFGYAVVDILNEDAQLGDDVSFKLYMGDIAANQPFILKVYQNITPEQFADANTTVKFTNKHIDNTPYNAIDKSGNKFIGIYEGKVGLESNEYLFRLGVNNYSAGGTGSVLRPLSAYIQFATTEPAPHMIYIEELNGGFTAISTVNADNNFNAEGMYNLNGMKLQSAPTQKGIYIQNGKKVVIK